MKERLSTIESEVILKVNQSVIDLCIIQAKKSIMNNKHGSVLFKGKDILGTGFNYIKSDNKEKSRPISIHSEKDCIKCIRFDKLIGADILNVRLNKSENLTFSAPCKGCRSLLRRKGIRKVFWFDHDGSLSYTRLN